MNHTLNIGIIGAGEGSTSFLADIVANKHFNFGCNEREFISKTGATMKYGIRHKGWTNNIDQSYVGPIDGSTTWSHNVDSNFLYGLANLPIEELHRTSAGGFLIRNKKSSFSKDLTELLPAHAYHFDAHKVGQYFKEICLNSGVTCINDQVIHVKLSESGEISSLLLESSKEVQGEFFIDASGFKRVLINEVGSKWISYKKHLPVNTALPFQIEYKQNEILEPTTLAWAQSSGWMWRIPVADRYGAGYVFDDNFITPEQAQAEIEKRLGHAIDPIRVLKFDTGRLDKFWNKNCLAIGLSSAFTEPLEAMSIHSTIVMLRWFTLDFLRSTIEDTNTNANQISFNKRCENMFETFKDFLVMHYMGGRNDSEFWKYVSSGATETENVSLMKQICKNRIPTLRDFENFEGSAGWPLWGYVMAGTGILTADIGKKEIEHFKIQEYSKKLFNDTESYLETNYNDLLDYTEFINMTRDSIFKGKV